MNTNKFFALCKEKGIEVAELTSSKNTSFSFTVFRNELSNYTLSTTSRIRARGIFNNQMGAAATEKDDRTTAEYLVNNILLAGQTLERVEKPIIFKGSEKYHKRNMYSKALEAWETSDKIAKVFELEKECKALDPRVVEVECQFEESVSENVMANSYGLNLKSKQNYYVVYAEVIVKDGEEVKTGYDVLLESDPSKFDVKEMAKKAVEKATSLLHGSNVKGAKYKAILDREVVSSLLGAVLSNLDAEEVQKHASVFEGKLNEQILSNKLTITEEPLKKNFFFTYHDDEGVATYNKKVIEKGVLKTYFYNLETAAKDGVQSTGNAQSMGARMGIGYTNITVKPGKLSLDELFEKIGNGVYITSVQGLHAGLNEKSGDFSLQAQGFLVKDGKKDHALGLFTVSGNLFKIFNEVSFVGSDNKLLTSSIDTPSLAIKHLIVSGD